MPRPPLNSCCPFEPPETTQEWVEKTLANAGKYSNLGPVLGPALKRKKNEEAKKKRANNDGDGDE